MSNASALIIEFIIERAGKQTGVEATDEDEYTNDVVASYNNEALDALGEVQLEQAIDREAAVEAAVEARRRNVQISDCRGAQAYQEKRRRLGKRVVESTIAESSRGSEDSRRRGQSSSRTTT